MPHEIDENEEVFEMLFNQSGINDSSIKSEALFEQSLVGGETSTLNWRELGINFCLCTG